MPRPGAADASEEKGTGNNDGKDAPDHNHSPVTKPNTLTKDDDVPSQRPTPLQDAHDSAQTASISAASAERPAGATGAAAHQDDRQETFVDARQPTSPGPRRSPRLSSKRSSEEEDLKGSEIENVGSTIARKRAKK
ncbi:hypothetical protein LTR86_001214 [Recurvomyces mirabilis]|nr:hypothetical protein LTR86_001214 [Recurvomyces mirabilis]